MSIKDIVVGTDGSAEGGRAVRWAAREARLSGSPLRIVTTFDWNWTSGRFTGGMTERQLAENAAGTVLADARLIAHCVAPGVPVSCVPEAGSAAAALIEAGRTAALLVVGSRGRGGFASLLLGSVCQQVATHAPCPVAVIRGRTDAPGPVTVGLDGGPTGQITLETAFGLVTARHGAVLAIRAYAEPGALWGSTIPPVVFDPVRIHHDEQAALEQEIAPWREKFPGVTVEARAVAGDARQVLIEASRSAQLLVMGGRSGPAAPGSVVLRTLHHADCPVVVARDPDS